VFSLLSLGCLALGLAAVSTSSTDFVFSGLIDFVFSAGIICGAGATGCALSRCRISPGNSGWFISTPVLPRDFTVRSHTFVESDYE